jgi:hypothetical protein
MQQQNKRNRASATTSKYQFNRHALVKVFWLSRSAGFIAD